MLKTDMIITAINCLKEKFQSLSVMLQFLRPIRK